MERRLAVHAGTHREKMIGRIALALVIATSTATAAPKAGEARVQFDRGVAAYTTGNYAVAAEALGASFVLEADPETLFAWAQTERKLGNCDRAIDLYSKLLAMDIPAANKPAIKERIDECKTVLASQKPKPGDKKKTEPKPDPKTKIEAKPVPPPVETKPVEPPPPPPPVETKPVEPPPVEPTVERRAWWKDPVGGALVGAGVIGLGVGTVFLVQGSAADSDKENATSYPEYERLADRAESRGRLGVIGLVAGGALVAGGVVWYVTRKPTSSAMSAWLAPSGGGVALNGRF